MRLVEDVADVFAARYLLSTVAAVITILQFLSGTLVCKQYVTDQTTGEATALPFLLGVLSCGLWLLYGLVIQDDTIIFVNTIGIILMTIYTVVFYLYTSTLKKYSIVKLLLVIVALLVFATFYVCTDRNTEDIIDTLGMSACSLTLLTIASPMSKLFHVVKVKSTECLPFPMILMSFFVSLLWFFYGMVVRDSYLLFTNGFGAGLATLQLSLFCFFPSRPPSRSLNKDILA